MDGARAGSRTLHQPELWVYIKACIVVYLGWQFDNWAQQLPSTEQSKSLRHPPHTRHPVAGLFLSTFSHECLLLMGHLCLLCTRQLGVWELVAEMDVACSVVQMGQREPLLCHCRVIAVSTGRQSTFLDKRRVW